MELVGIGNGESRQHEEEDGVPENEIGGEVTQLSNLAEELTPRLGEGVPSHVVPLAGPPSDVGLVILELTGEGQGDDKLVDEPLDCHHGNHTGDGTGPIERFKDEQNLEEDDEDYDSDSMRNRRQNCTKLLAAHTEDGSHTASHTKE